MYNYAEGIKEWYNPSSNIKLCINGKESCWWKIIYSKRSNSSKIVVKDSDATFADQAKAYFRGSAEKIYPQVD